MRRFITSSIGKLVSHTVILALVLPYLSLNLAAKAEAQVQVLPSWIVTEFKNLKAPSTQSYGQSAARAVASELAKSGRYDILPDETVARTVESLGLTLPLVNDVNIMRVGDELRATTVVTGEIVDYGVREVNGGRQGWVSMRVVAYDVSSGLVINGAAVSGSSTVRSGDVAEETLVGDAINMAANAAVREMESRTLPTATILNTVTDSALINQGTRSGFQVGMRVIVSRGREQVATGRVTSVEPDMADIRAERTWKGMRPGDKVRAIHNVPTILPGAPVGNQANVQKTRARGNNSGLISLLLVVGLVAVLLGGGNSSSQDATAQFKAEATMFPDASGQPAVRLSWSANGFAKGNANQAQWQLYRSDDGFRTPVLVAGGTQRQAFDTDQPRGPISYADFGQVGGTTCDFGEATNTDVDTMPGVIPGQPYRYQIDLVYSLSILDLPSGGSGGSTGGIGGGTGGIGGGTGGIGGGTGGIGGGTGGGTTGGGTTGGGTGGTGGGDEVCFFQSARSTSGLATPLARIQLNSPVSNAVVSQPTVFSFQSVVNPAFPITAEYVVQFSNSPTFPSGSTVTVAKFIRTDQGTLSTPVIDTAGSNIPVVIRNSSEVYWRIGARNVADSPGPVPDASGQRYIFSPPRRFTRPASPPPPPL